MYLADSRTTPQPAGPPGAGPSRNWLPTVPATVLALGTVSLITDVSAEMVTAVLPLYLVTALGLSPLGFGLLDGVYNGVSALVRLLGGHLADRGQRHKATAAAGYALSALGKPALLAVHSALGLAAVLAIDRTGKGLRTAPRDAMISLAAGAAEQGRCFGVHRAMDTTGALLGPITAFAVLHAAAGGFDAVFTVSFCCAAAGVLVLLLCVPTPTPTLAPAAAGATVNTGAGAAAGAGAEAGAGVSWRAAAGLLRRRELRRLAACALLLGLATLSDAFIYLLAQRRLGLPAAWLPLLPLVTAAAFLTLAVPLGQAADRFGRWRLFLAGHAALLAAYALLLAGPGGPALPLALTVLVLHGAFYAATDGVLMAAAATATPPQLRSSGLALVQTGQAAARLVCSVAFGAAWTAFGQDSALAGAAAALAAGAAACAAWRPQPTPEAAR